MADASIIDIGGTQWNVKDREARNDIATIKQLITPEVLPNIEITLNSGYNGYRSSIINIQKYGKLYMGLIFINDLAGEKIGTNDEVDFAIANISLNNRVDAIGIEFFSSKPVRVSIHKNGAIHMQESAGVTSGNNSLRIPITWIEA